MSISYNEFREIFICDGHLQKAFLYIGLKYDIDKTGKLDIMYESSSFTKESFFESTYVSLINCIKFDFKYIERKHRKSVIDEIDKKITDRRDNYRLIESDVRDIIDDFYYTSSTLKRINSDTTEYYDVLLQKICYDKAYLKSTDDIIEQYIYEMVNFVYFDFLYELSELFEKHDIDIFTIQKNINRFIYDEEEYKFPTIYSSNDILPTNIYKNQEPPTNINNEVNNIHLYLKVGTYDEIQTKQLYDECNKIVFEKCNVESFVNSLNNPYDCNLKVKNKSLLYVLYNNFPNFFRDDDDKIKDILNGKFGILKDDFQKHKYPKKNPSGRQREFDKILSEI